MVLREVRAKLSALKPVSEELNEVSDTLRDEIKTIEEELAVLKLGVALTLPRPFEDTPLREEWDESEKVVKVVFYEWRLAYARHEGSWRLVAKKFKKVRGGVDPYGNGPDDYVWDEFEDETKPLLEAPRARRIMAADDIGRLLDHLKSAAEEKIASVRKVTDAKK